MLFFLSYMNVQTLLLSFYKHYGNVTFDMFPEHLKPVVVFKKKKLQEHPTKTPLKNSSINDA